MKTSVIKKVTQNFIWFLCLTLLISSCALFSDDGYVEVRNHTDIDLEKVNWDSTVFLGNIKPGNEDGGETGSTGTGHVYMEIQGETFRTEEQITVDGRSSATLIVKDTAKLIRMD